MPRLPGLVGMMLLCSAAAAYGTGKEPIVNASIAAAGQDGPLEIVGFRPEYSDRFALHIRNVSDKATRDFWVEPLIRDSKGRFWHFANGHAALRPGEGTMPAGGEAWIAIQDNSA
ncbi:MAG: hypothetical protein WCD49_04385 [Candidatus Acidiferrales bacterium]